MFGYDVIDADPPWQFETYSDAGLGKSADAHYKTIGLDAIKALPVGDLARGDCLLTLWTCGWAIANGAAHEVAKSWGATPVSLSGWRKVTRNGKVRMGPGYRVRTVHEPILVCTFGNPAHKALLSLIDGIAREHSRKPDEWYSHLVDRTPKAMARAALFTRESRPGFECWGDEHGKFDQVAA
jgi:N6-adenosine-specific RNA methylase IME4